MIPLGKPYLPKSVLPSIEHILESGRLVEGAQCGMFSDALCDYTGASHTVLVNSGTSALYLALKVMGVGRGDAVVIPAFSFPATANAVEWLEAAPIFADVNPDTWNIDIDTLDACLAKLSRSQKARIKAVMPVQSFGNPVDILPILKRARQNGWKVIEDAACALGSTLNGQACGTHGDLGCFSFHPRKILTTSEGGAILARSATWARKLDKMKNHGMENAGGRIRFTSVGLNFRFTEIAAAIGLSQMAELDRMLEQRRSLAESYLKAFRRRSWKYQGVLPGAETNWQSMVVRLPFKNKVTRDGFIASMGKSGIQVNIGTYLIPGTDHYRKRFAARKGQWPAAESIFREGVTVPLFAGMGNEVVKRVMDCMDESAG